MTTSSPTTSWLQVSCDASVSSSSSSSKDALDIIPDDTRVVSVEPDIGFVEQGRTPVETKNVSVKPELVFIEPGSSVEIMSIESEMASVGSRTWMVWI